MFLESYFFKEKEVEYFFSFFLFNKIRRLYLLWKYKHLNIKFVGIMMLNFLGFLINMLFWEKFMEFKL